MIDGVQAETAPDGRIGYPAVVEYRITKTGEVVIVPPLGGEAYKPVIKDLALYEALERAGYLSSEQHRGARGPLIDNRKILM